MKKIEKKYSDNIIFFIAYTLLIIGCIIIISSSYNATKVYKFTNIHFVYKHFIFSFLSLIFMNIIQKHEKHLKKIGHVIWGINVILLICVILFGHSAKGAKRWISILGFNFQPSEFIKIGIILQSSYFLRTNFYLYFLTYAIPLSFIILQPDLGTVLLLSCLACVQLINQNNKINFKLIGICFISLLFILISAYFCFSHVHERINLFLYPSNDVFGIGYQKHKAFLTIINGGFFGKGFGKGEMKDLLPDAHTDYIFAVIAEEFGILGSCLVIFLFILLGLRCRKLTTKNEYFDMVQFSSIILILGQAWLNMASTLSIIPAKGIPLPLISYGGSGIISQGVLFGILLAVSNRKSKIQK